MDPITQVVIVILALLGTVLFLAWRRNRQDRQWRQAHSPKSGK